MKKTHYSIISDGMGGFLNPPNDPEHRFHVKARYRNGSGRMSLRSALGREDELPDDIRGEINRLFADNPPQFTEEWEHSCYNYFRNCYSPDGVNKNASGCVTDSQNRKSPHFHSAFLHIQKFFPDYEPNEYLIGHNGDKGQWSKQKEENK